MMHLSRVATCPNGQAETMGRRGPRGPRAHPAVLWPRFFYAVS